MADTWEDWRDRGIQEWTDFGGNEGLQANLDAGTGLDWGSISKDYEANTGNDWMTGLAKESTGSAEGTTGPVNPFANSPTLKLPMLNLSDKTSVLDQYNTLSSKDSNLRQQARINAQESGVASGAIHGSQQAGAAERTVMDSIMPLAELEANRVASEEIGNWQQKTNELTLTYTNQYAEHLANLGYDNALTLAMASANTQLSTAMMGNVTTLLNNTDLELSDDVWAKLSDILNSGQDNNNLILGMGFSY